MCRLTVKGWANFQHYKDRAPPWIKLHKTLLDNFEYQSLPLASRALAPMLWLLASEQIDGSIDADPRKLAFRLRTSVDEVVAGLNPLIESGFFVGDSIMLASCKQGAMPETETETATEVKAETPLAKKTKNNDNQHFETFWKLYPKKVGKDAARKSWDKLKAKAETLSLITDALAWQTESEQWQKEGGQFIPNPSTYLNQARWLDQPIAKQSNVLGKAGMATREAATRFLERG
jgi:hypothetical protein